MQPFMEYCFHVLADALSCYLESLDKLQKRICRTVGPSLAASLEPLVHRRNVASLSLFYRYYFGRCSSELAQLVPLPFYQGRSILYSDKLHDFSVTILSRYKDDYANSFFPCTTKLWKSLPIECFPSSYDLNGFKSRINSHLEYEKNCNRKKNLSVEEYLNEIKPYLKDVLIDLQKPAPWKIQLTMAVNLTSSKDSNEEQVIHLKSDNIEVMTYDKYVQLISQKLTQLVKNK